jgi:hypothetical protein
MDESCYEESEFSKFLYRIGKNTRDRLLRELESEKINLGINRDTFCELRRNILNDTIGVVAWTNIRKALEQN